MSLPPPTQEATYFCNKCGHFGRAGHTHSNCDYYAAKFGPYWDEAAVKLAVREALERAASECCEHYTIVYPITGALYNGRCEDRIRALIKEYE